jgi:hypothetical protein
MELKPSDSENHSKTSFILRGPQIMKQVGVSSKYPLKRFGKCGKAINSLEISLERIEYLGDKNLRVIV